MTHSAARATARADELPGQLRLLGDGPLEQVDPEPAQLGELVAEEDARDVEHGGGAVAADRAAEPAADRGEERLADAEERPDARGDAPVPSRYSGSARPARPSRRRAASAAGSCTCSPAARPRATARSVWSATNARARSVAGLGAVAAVIAAAPTAAVHRAGRGGRLVDQRGSRSAP